MANELVTLSDIERMAKYAVDSQLFGFKTIPQAASLMLLCQAKGMHPMEALEEFHIINGRHSMKAERMLAKFQAAGGKVQWLTLTDERAEATFSHPQGGSVTIDWDIERAKRAGLAGKDVWKAYGRAMLRSRVISEGIKSTLPGVTAGVYTPEEAVDIPAEVVEKDITPPPEKPLTGVAALQAKIAKVAEAIPAPADDGTLQELRSAAMLGSGALKRAWEDLPKEYRKTFAAELDGLKAAAAEADDRLLPAA